MGSDMYLGGHPKKRLETYEVASDEEAMEYVVGAMAVRKEVTLEPLNDGRWRVKVWDGESWFG